MRIARGAAAGNPDSGAAARPSPSRHILFGFHKLDVISLLGYPRLHTPSSRAQPSRIKRIPPSKASDMNVRSVRHFLLAVAVSCVTSLPAGAQVISLDLSGIGSLSRTVEPGSIDVVIENRIPLTRYAITVRRELIPIAAISLEPIGSLGGLAQKTVER